MTDFNKNAPIYLQIAEHITKDILAGSYAPGEKLPSVREIAAREGVNPNTAQRALSSLEDAGLVITERTSGRFVTEDTTEIERIRWDTAKELIADFKRHMAEIGFSAEKLAVLLEQTEGENTKS